MRERLTREGHRPDIEGLRGLAVLAVILFHIDARALPGGFVGVDIFFVISGYLITGILANDLQDGRFSIRGFYERRIRRILPALWAVLLICVPVSWWLMLPADAEPMAKSAIWSALAMANVYFWREAPSDYFAPQSAQFPFLHLWSLGVEEQFYLLWPAVLWATWKLARGRPVAVAGALAALVVAAATVAGDRLLAANEARFAYYMLPARAGELAVGAIVALAWPARRARLASHPRVVAASAAFGWVLLGVSLIGLNEHQPFPGWRALLPTLGAAALIATGRASPANAWLAPLRVRPALWLGRCSYSAYLWHWPVLAWWRYLWGQPSPWEGVPLFALILLLARLSQAWIEDPARRARLSWRRTVVAYGLAPALAVAAMALVVARADRWGLPLYPADARRAWAALDDDTRPAHRVAWVCQQHVLDARSLFDPACEFGSGAASARIMLLGDSYAAQFAPLLRVAAEMQGVRVRSVALGSCAALPGPLSGIVAGWRVAACEDGMQHILERARDFPLLIVGGAWETYARNDPTLWKRLEAQLRELVAAGHRVWLLPGVPEVTGYDAACLAKRRRVGSWLACPTHLPPTDPSDATNRRLAELAASIPGVRFLPLHAGLCAGSQCPVVDEEGRPLYADPVHLSVHGAVHLAEKLREAGTLPDLAAPDPATGPVAATARRPR